MSSLFGKRKRSVRIGDTRPAKKSNADEKESGVTLGTEQEELVEDPYISSFEDFCLEADLVHTCQSLGFRQPTPVQKRVIPFLLKNRSSHLLALAATGTGKTAAFGLPILHHWARDPYGIYAVILTPTRELAQQIHEQILALGSRFRVTSCLVVGGMDVVRQATQLDRDRPAFVVATPGRLAALLRGPQPPRLNLVRYLVLDEADRLLVRGAGFEKDVAETILACRHDTKRQEKEPCQMLLFSATLTDSLENIEEMAGGGMGKLPLRRFLIDSKGTTEKMQSKEKSLDTSKSEGPEKDEPVGVSKIPEGLKQEYIFMPARVRDTYLLTAMRTLMAYGGRSEESVAAERQIRRKKRSKADDDADDPEVEATKARSAIIFVASCERAALVSGILSHVGVDNVALHSLLSQNRRLASLAKFKSQRVRVLVATDVASRGLDIPTVDLVINASLPRQPVTYLHRVGRTARAGRRGHAVSLVAPPEVAYVQAAEKMAGRPLLKCESVTDDLALPLLGSVLKATRLVQMKLMDIGFDELVTKFKQRKAQDKKERRKIVRALQKIEAAEKATNR